MRRVTASPGLLAAVALLAGGCRFEWNGEAPIAEVEGAAPALSSYPRLNALPSGTPTLLTGVDGAPWVAFCEYRSGSSGFRQNGTCQRMHLVRVSADGLAGDETITGEAVGLHPLEVLVVEHPDGSTRPGTLRVHRPGDPGPDFEATIAPVPEQSALGASSDGAVISFALRSGAVWTFDLVRLDGTHRRQVQVTVTPTSGMGPGSMGNRTFPLPRNLLTGDGAWLVVREASGATTAWSTRDDRSVPLGTRPATLLIDDAHAALVTAGDDGLRSVRIDDGSERVLAPQAIDPNTLSVPADLAFAWFGQPDGLHRVPLDGSVPAALVVPGATRLLAVGPDGQPAWSHDSRLAYTSGAGDGWLGGARFMERGRIPRWSSDGERLHFLEHAANIGGVGDLSSVTLPAGAPRTLGLNVSGYAELADGRVLALENAPYTGTWNRLVVIDEAAATKRWVVPAAAAFVVPPNGGQVIAAVVVGGSGYDIVRAPIPPQ